MKKFMKQWMTLALAVMMLVTAVPMGNVEAKAKKLSKKDFQYTVDSKKHNFLTESKKSATYYQILYTYSDTKSGKSKKYCKGTVDTVKTKRNIKWGSTETAVMKQYGKAKKKKVSKTEKCFKFIKYDCYTVDTSAWKNYLEYNYKQGKDKYKLRFYLDKKNNVTAIIYIKNLNKWYNYPNKEAESGIYFKAPSGKKVTTKIIGGKKVYIIPKGTKVCQNKKKRNIIMDGVGISQYSVKGELKATSDSEGIPNGETIEEVLKRAYLWDAKKGEPVWSNPERREVKHVNPKKLGSYRYFTIACYEIDGSEGAVKLAPQIIYFRYE